MRAKNAANFPAANNTTTTLKSYFKSSIKNGLLKSYKHTARVDKKELFDIVVNKLQALLKGYLQHRFVVANDRYYWKSFLNNTEHPVLWFDYSQNINFVEKKSSSICSLFRKTTHLA